MLKKVNRVCDGFTFSLRGIKTIASFTAPWAIADDRLIQAREERPNEAHDDQPDTAREIVAIRGRYWLTRRRRAA